MAHGLQQAVTGPEIQWSCHVVQLEQSGTPILWVFGIPTRLARLGCICITHSLQRDRQDSFCDLTNNTHLVEPIPDESWQWFVPGAAEHTGTDLDV